MTHNGVDPAKRDAPTAPAFNHEAWRQRKVPDPARSQRAPERVGWCRGAVIVLFVPAAIATASAIVSVLP